MVHPKVVKSVHYCPTTGKVIERRYTDMTSFDAFPSLSVYPTKVYFRLLKYFLSNFLIYGFT